MRSELLRNRIVVQRKTGGQASNGEPLDVWVDVARLWADIRHPSGLEATKADAPTSVVKASIRIRYRTDLDAGMRVVHGATIYNILAVLPGVAQKESIDLLCEVAS